MRGRNRTDVKYEILVFFCTLKFKLSVNFYMGNGKAPLVSRRGTHFHVQFYLLQHDSRKTLLSKKRVKTRARVGSGTSDRLEEWLHFFDLSFLRNVGFFLCFALGAVLMM